MNYWRMAFRVGAGGREMWPECLRRGIAAITYEPLSEVNLSQYPTFEPKALWQRLESSQKFSLGAVAYKMKKGDVIFVKQGPEIISRGVVRNGYTFESSLDLRDHNGLAWPHQVPVVWERNFLRVKCLVGAEMSTIKLLTASDIEKLKKTLGKDFGPGWDKNYAAPDVGG